MHIRATGELTIIINDSPKGNTRIVQPLIRDTSGLDLSTLIMEVSIL